MSIEAAIQENTAALKLLTEAIHAGRAAGVAKQTAATPPAGGAALPPKQAAEAAQREKPPAPAAQQQQAQPVNYDQMKTAVNALAKAKGRDSVIAALGKFGIAKATEATPEQWPELLAELNAQAVAA